MQTRVRAYAVGAGVLTLAAAAVIAIAPSFTGDGVSAGGAPVVTAATSDMTMAPVRQSFAENVGSEISSVEWVGAKTTGVPAGTNLTVINGDVTITTPGYVLDGADVRGIVLVRAPNVTIKNSIIRGRSSYPSAVALIMADSANGQNLLVQDTEIASTVASPYVNGVNGSNFTLRRVNIHDVIDQVHVYGDNVLIERSWLHNNLHYANDPVHGGTPSHDDNVQVQKGNNVKLIDNFMSGSHNAAVQTTQDQGPISNLEIRGNYFDNGSCTLNINDKSKGSMVNTVITGNTFGMGGKYKYCAMQIPSPTTAPTITNNWYVDGAVATWRRS